MRRQSLSRWAALAVALALGLSLSASSARAEFFEFSGTVSINGATAIPAGSAVVGNGTTSATLTTPAGTPITLTALNSSDPNFHEDATGSGTDIVFGNISVSTTPTTPFQTIGFDFVYTLTITDFSSPFVGGPPTGTGVLTVSGHLAGSVGAGRKVNLDQLSNYATTPASGVVTAGAETYRFTLNTFVPPGTTASGIMGAHVQVPEPASVALMGLGGVGLLGWFRGRRAKAQATA